MEQVLLVVQAMIAVALIGMVLIQRSDSDGFGLGSGGGGNLLSGRTSANLMTRTTAILAALFIINSLALSLIAAHSRPASIIETIEEQEADGSKAIPAVPAADADKKPAMMDKKAVEKIEGAAQKPEAVIKKISKPVVKPADASSATDESTDSN